MASSLATTSFKNRDYPFKRSPGRQVQPIASFGKFEHTIELLFSSIHTITTMVNVDTDVIFPCI